jgi:hypothetical protein
MKLGPVGTEISSRGVHSDRWDADLPHRLPRHQAGRMAARTVAQGSLPSGKGAAVFRRQDKNCRSRVFPVLLPGVADSPMKL